jgi:glutamate carboxypeptidase
VPEPLRLTSEQSAAMFDMLREMTLIESATSDKAGNDRLLELVRGRFEALGATVEIDAQAEFGDHLVARWPGDGKPGLVIGHIDTVWPIGTLTDMPYREEDGNIYGPGVLDMKAGISATITALDMLRDSGNWPERALTVLVNSDEEVGSPSSRPLVEAEAAKSAYTIVMEPGIGDSLKTARKGLGEFRLHIKGRASHAGAFPEDGISAIEEMAHQILRIQELKNWDLGTTINVGLITGGSARNTIPAEANAVIDVRITSADEGQRVTKALYSLDPVNPEISLEMTGALHRPPMEREGPVAELFRRVQSIGAELGLELSESSTGGGSDANLTAALGIPTIDGMGAVGDHPHADGEYLVVSELPKRANLLAHCLRIL